MRHELLLEKRSLGRLIGPGGVIFKDLITRTGCQIIVIDTEVPPGYPEPWRLVVLVGTPQQLTSGVAEVNAQAQGRGTGSGQALALHRQSVKRTGEQAFDDGAGVTTGPRLADTAEPPDADSEAKRAKP